MRLYIHFLIGVLGFLYGVHNFVVWTSGYLGFLVLHFFVSGGSPRIVDAFFASIFGWLFAAETKARLPRNALLPLAVAAGFWLVYDLESRKSRKIVLLEASHYPKFQVRLPVTPSIELHPKRVTVLELREGTAWMGLRDAANRKMFTRIWGFLWDKKVHSPGPTLRTNHYTTTHVRWENHLPRRPHFLPVDPTIHIAQGYNAKKGSIPTVVHLHGGHTDWESDGHPEAWFTQGFQRTGSFFRRKTYAYENSEDATLLWYHDHTMGMTRLNNYAGLWGLYVITDPNEKSLIELGILPSQEDTVELAITDKLFTTEGQLYYPGVHGEPTSGVEIEPQFPNPTQLHEFWGEFILVNGVCWPTHSVEPKRYRVRILNASDTRTYVLKFENDMTFYKVGTDGGLLESPVPLASLVLAPAQRADLVVDFGSTAGKSVDLLNIGGDILFKGFVPKANPGATAELEFQEGFLLSDGKGGTAPATNPATTGRIMRFLVSKSRNSGTAAIVSWPPPGRSLRARPIRRWSAADVDRERDIVLFKGEDWYGRNTLLLGNLVDGSLLWAEAPTETVALNTVEVWNIYNATVSGHPIHLHLVEFQVIQRRPFEGELLSKDHFVHGKKISGGRLTNVSWAGERLRSSMGDVGEIDTVVALPQQVTTIVAFFDRPGHYVFHCHLLSHEDWMMMRKIYVREDHEK